MHHSVEKQEILSHQKYFVKPSIQRISVISTQCKPQFGKTRKSLPCRMFFVKSKICFHANLTIVVEKRSKIRMLIYIRLKPHAKTLNFPFLSFICKRLKRNFTNSSINVAYCITQSQGFFVKSTLKSVL